MSDDEPAVVRTQPPANETTRLLSQGEEEHGGRRVEQAEQVLPRRHRPTLQSWIGKFSIGIFYSFCFLSGQLITDFSKKKYGYVVITFSELTWIFCGLFLLANLGSLSFNIYVIARCPYKYCTYFCAKYYNSHDLLDAFVRSSIQWVNETSDYEREDILGGVQPETDEEYENWNKVYITSATVSGFLSYYMLVILVLIPNYSTLCCCLHKSTRAENCIQKMCSSWHKSHERKDVLLPFCDNPVKDNQKQSTALRRSQKGFFLFFYGINLVFFFASLTVFIKIMLTKLSKGKISVRDKDINESGLMFQFLSQFCAIQSCFIFSKIAYGITNEYIKLSEKFELLDLNKASFQRFLWCSTVEQEWSAAVDSIADILDEQSSNEFIKLRPQFNDAKAKYKSFIFIDDNEDDGNVNNWDRLQPNANFYIDQARLAVFKMMDKNFIKGMEASVTPYTHWFAVHWFLYTVTTFMSTAFLVETYIRFLYKDQTEHPNNKPWWDAEPEKVWNFSYITLFCLTHAFLFIYPCFRAAMITASRNKVVKKFACHEWVHIPLSVQNAFHSHLQAEDFGFKISFFCTEITFGFNLAFVSIFIGMFGIIMKLSL